MPGTDLIAAERARQIAKEGWTSEHDDASRGGQLARAAVCYAMNRDQGCAEWPPDDWPWHVKFWKPCPGDRVRELVKAGALIAAEIDRLQRQGGGERK